MFKIVVFISLLLTSVGFSSEPPKLRYALSFEAIRDGKILIECEFQGSETGSTEVTLPNQFANQEALYKNLNDLRSDGHLIGDTDQPSRKMIQHRPGEKLRFTYSVDLLSKEITHENYFRPIGDVSYFYAIGHGMFILPTEGNSEVAVSLQWEHLPRDWTIANSFGTKELSQEFVCSIDKLKSAAFLGGDFQLISCGSDSHPIYIASRGAWPFSKVEFANKVEQIITSQRSFWNDFEFPYYLISIIPIDLKNTTAGTALTNCFSLFLGDNDFSEEEYIKHLACLISHEHFHTWNGVKIRFSEPEGSMYWFSEGFTEYYSGKLNYLHGIMSESDYIEYVNVILKDYFSSPFHGATNEEIIKGFWKDAKLGRLPYVRGFSLALYLDAKLQSQGNSLDQFMLNLFAFSKSIDRPLSANDLCFLISRYITQDDLQSIRGMVLNGVSVPVPQTLGNNPLIWKDADPRPIPQYLQAEDIAGEL